MFDKFSLSGLDLYAPLTIPMWAAGAAVAVLLLLLVVALSRGGLGAVTRVAFLVLAVAAAWVLFNWMEERDRIEARRALNARLDELVARVLAPNSVLGCLEPGLGDAVDNACEKEIFGSPEAVGAATALVAARWTLLGRAVDYGKRDPGFDARLDHLRRSLQADRYGLLAQVLVTREGCTATRCDGLDRLSDPSRVRANLADRTFENIVARNAMAWANRAHPPLAATTTAPGANVSFPSAASIPPVSIMSTEPGAAAPAAAAPTPARKPPPAQPKAQPRPAAVRPAPISPRATGTTAPDSDQ